MPRKDRPRKTPYVGGRAEIERRVLTALEGGGLTADQLVDRVWEGHALPAGSARIALAPALAALARAFKIQQVPDGRYSLRFPRRGKAAP